MKSERFFEFRSKQLVFNHVKHTEIEPYAIASHYHDVYELLYVKSGDLYYYVEGKKYRVKKNSLILTRPHLNHMIEVNPPSNYERYDFIFEDSVIVPSILEKLSDDINVINLNDQPQISEIFAKTDYYSKHFDGEEIKKILCNLLEEVFYNLIIISKKDLSDRENGNYSSNSIVSAAIEYIDNNLSTPFNVDSLCKELYISKSYLHELFMQHLQTTPKKHITSKRLLLAQSKIRAFAKSTDVYAECGFSDYSSFYRAYKKYFGYSPSEELEHKIHRVIDF